MYAIAVGADHAGYALKQLLAEDIARDRGPLVSPTTHHAPRAKSVILLFQNGGPSQMDLFDPKPELQKYNGKQHSF